MPYVDFSERLSPENTFPDAMELRERIQALVAASGGKAKLRQIGASEGGLPIDLVEIGEGKRSALLVGTPHPNEPIGCHTILSMLELLIRDPAAIGVTGFRWNFIPTIEPDGLMLNSGWLKGPRTPEHYLENFYRPCFDQQAEFTFPADRPGWKFDRPTQGNIAWQAAFAQTKPDYLVSLHNAEYGAVFYLLSSDLPGLPRNLVEHPGHIGLTMNTFGDSSIDTVPMGPGVFPVFDPTKLIAGAIEGGKQPEKVWPGGLPSNDYALAKYGTFSLIAEIPYWNDPRVHDNTPSGIGHKAVLAEAVARNEIHVEFLLRSFSRLAASAPASAMPFVRALREVLMFAEGKSMPGNRNTKAAADMEDRMFTVGEHALVSTSLHLFSLRPLSMMARLADAAGDADVAKIGRKMVAEGLAELRKRATFDVIPLRDLVGLQLNAVLAGAEALNNSAV